MKTRFLLSILGAAFLAFGCSKNEPAEATAAQADAKSGPRTIEITAGDTMKYNLTSIEASPGEEITIVLKNIGTQPKEVMGHDWVLLKGGVDATAFVAAAAQAKATDYMPEGKIGDVLAHTKMLGPKQSDTVTFKVPTEKGDYVFLCSFPAHYQVGMHGKLTVK